MNVIDKPVAGRQIADSVIVLHTKSFRMKWKKRFPVILILFLSVTIPTRAADTLIVEEVSDSPKIKTFALLQLWTSYTTGEQIFDLENQGYEFVDNRLNIWFRRAILGFKAQPFPNIDFKLMAAYDGVGKDSYAGANGSINNTALSKIGILETYVHWQWRPLEEGFHLFAGYFRPQIGRESMTSSWGVTSMDRTLDYIYLRKQLTGSAFGRAAGLHLGGLFLYPEQNLGFEYGLGLFNPQLVASANSGSQTYSPLLTARGAIHFGDSEMERYKIYREVNFLSRRRGLTLAANAAWQGSTDLFRTSTTLSADLLFNWGAFNLDGEWSFFWRSGEESLADEETRSFKTSSQTGHVRISYNLESAAKNILEPSLAYMFFLGALDEAGQTEAALLAMAGGYDQGLDFGLNWYLYEGKCKLLLHYNWRWGKSGAAGEGATVNYYFSQTGIGAIKRGNWLGAGVNLKF